MDEGNEMRLTTKIALQLLKRDGYRLEDIWDSWQLVLADSATRDEHAFRRKMNHYLLFRQLRTLIETHRIGLVVDVGAHVGSFAQSLRKSGYSDSILSVEPNPEHHAKLRHDSSTDPTWDIVPHAIGLSPGTVDIRIPTDGSFASTLPMTADAERIFGSLVSGTRSVRVEQFPLSEIIRLHEIESQSASCPILLKTDTQGLDRVVVQSAGHLIDERIKVLLVEIPVIALYEGVGGLSSNNEYYESLGFRAAGAYPISWTQGDEVVEFDFVYVRRSD